MNADTAGASADQQQTNYTADFLTTVHSKPEPEQSPARLEISIADLQPRMPSAPASSPVGTGEPAAAPDAPPAQSSAPPVPETVFKLAEQIRIQVRDGKGAIRIQLNPSILGRLEIRAENAVQGVSVRIAAESEVVKSYLENNLQVLHQTLQDQSLKIDRIEIVSPDAFNIQSSLGFSAQSSHTGSEQNNREQQSSSERSGSSPASPAEDMVPDSSTWRSRNPGSRFHTVA
jgi:flagellar hook-length control protein FliK